jgi:hypothetical protein
LDQIIHAPQHFFLSIDGVVRLATTRGNSLTLGVPYKLQDRGFCDSWWPSGDLLGWSLPSGRYFLFTESVLSLEKTPRSVNGNGATIVGSKQKTPGRHGSADAQGFLLNK